MGSEGEQLALEFEDWDDTFPDQEPGVPAAHVHDEPADRGPSETAESIRLNLFRTGFAVYFDHSGDILIKTSPEDLVDPVDRPPMPHEIRLAAREVADMHDALRIVDLLASRFRSL